MKKKIFVIIILVTVIFNISQPSNNIGKSEDMIPRPSLIKSSTL